MSAPASPNIQGTQVHWGIDADGPQFFGTLHMTQSVGFQDRYEETIRVKDGAGITQTVAFNDYVSEASAEIVVAANQPMPEVSEMIVETTTGKKWLVTDRGRTMTNTDIWRASYTLMRGEGTLFA